ncbi:MAG: MOSC domain-containing protein [Bacteroidetes bacterium]|nr:MAG: MOSC domain-containing protein [Bacteroidota bacterium]
MARPQVSALFIYPVKSTRAVALDRVEVTRLGPRDDRRWMLVDPDGRAVTQREAPRLALVAARPEGQGLRVTMPGETPLWVPVPPADAPRIPVRVWDDRFLAALADEAVHRAFSSFLGRSVRLVHQPDEVVRPVDPTYGRAGDRVSLADGFPLLLTTGASLDELNRRLEAPVPMVRFRPNLVLEGLAPFEEDRWRRIRVGAMTFRVVKPCARCVVTTVDPATGTVGHEPLRTLATFRRRGSKVFFGQNLIPEAPGVLYVGDPVEVLDEVGVMRS